MQDHLAEEELRAETVSPEVFQMMDSDTLDLSLVDISAHDDELDQLEAKTVENLGDRTERSVSIDVSHIGNQLRRVSVSKLIDFSLTRFSA